MAAMAFGRRAPRRGVAVCVLAAMLVGCTATRPVDLQGTAGLVETVQPHDRVVVATTDGRELAFEVVDVEPDALVGKDERGEAVRVERDAIASLEVTRFSPTRTAGLAVGTGVSAFVIAGIIVAAIAPALILAAAAP